MPEAALQNDWVTIAVLGKPRGNRGELSAVSLSDSPGRFEALRRVTLFRDDGKLADLPVENTWFHDGHLVVKFAGVDEISSAEKIAGCELRVPLSERAPLEPGSYYQTDLLGCDLIDEKSGASLGRVTAWEEYGAAPLMEIDGDWLVPFTPSICHSVDIDARRIAVNLPEGLRELNRL